MSGILADFPANFAPREIQKEILREIEERIGSGYKRIILSAPTGVGKSLVAGAVARFCQRSFIVTATKHLQDQYTSDMEFLKPVKGKSNFTCRKLMKNQAVRSSLRAKRRGLTCEKGQCVQRIQGEDGKIVEETCEFKPKIKDIENGRYDMDACDYYLQKYRALVAPHSLWNYYSYFQIMRYNQKLFADYLDRRLAVFDEAHKIEDQIVQFIGVNIYKGAIDDCKIDLTAYDLTDIDSLIALADSIAESYARRLKELEDKEDESGQNSELIARLKSRYDRISQARVDMVDDRENFVINRPETDYNGEFRSVAAKPIDISKYCKEFFKTDLQLYMSATIDRDSFCENMGIDPKEVAVVDTPRSPFPIEHRRVDFLDVRRLNNRSTQEDRMAVIRKIDDIMTRHSEHRGLILTSSVHWCHEIKDGLVGANRERVRICHSKNRDGRTQEDILDEHAGVSNSVLLSSSLWEGVDLKDDLSRFQIIAKVPYPNLGEKRIGEKMHRFPLWYDSQTLMKLLQGFGRSIRNDGDWARTYVLDSAVHHVLNRARPRIPRAYHDILGWTA